MNMAVVSASEVAVKSSDSSPTNQLPKAPNQLENRPSKKVCFGNSPQRRAWKGIVTNPPHPFSYTYERNSPFIDNIEETEKLFRSLGGNTAGLPLLSEEERSDMIKRAANTHFKAAVVFNRLLVDADLKMKKSAEEKKSLEQEVAALKEQLRHSRHGERSAARMAEKDSLAARDYRRERDRLREELDAIKYGPPPSSSSERQADVEIAARIDSLRECKGKFDQVRRFLDLNSRHDPLLKLLHQVRGKAMMVELLEKGGTQVPSIIKGEIESTFRDLEKQIQELPKPFLDSKVLEPPSFFREPPSLYSLSRIACNTSSFTGYGSFLIGDPEPEGLEE